MTPAMVMSVLPMFPPVRVTVILAIVSVTMRHRSRMSNRSTRHFRSRERDRLGIPMIVVWIECRIL